MVLIATDLDPVDTINDIVEVWLEPVAPLETTVSIAVKVKGCTEEEPYVCDALENPDELEPAESLVLYYDG